MNQIKTLSRIEQNIPVGRKLKVLLIWPKARTDPAWGGDLGAIAEPLALEYLATGAELEGHEPAILDLRLHHNMLDETLNEFQPDIVGITAFSMHVRAALAIAQRVKELLPECATVVGGHHATFLPEDFFESQIDFVVSGEGVEPFVQLLRSLSSNRRDLLPRISGLWYRRQCYFALGHGKRSFTLDTLPAPNRKLILKDRANYFIDWMTPVACIRSTVGCPYRCTFCSLWQMTGGRYHRRSDVDFVAELSEISEDFVFLIDDEAFINKQRMISIAAMLAEQGIRKRFFAYARIDTILRQREALEAWREVGLERLMVGIDASTSKDLAEYNKGYDLSQIERALRVAEELKIEVLAQFVVNTDFTLRDFDRLARFVEHQGIRYPSFTVLTPLPGTPMLENFSKIIVRQANGRPDWDYFDTQNAVTTTRLPPQVFRDAYRALFSKFGSSYAIYRDQGSLRRTTFGHSSAPSLPVRQSEY